MNFTSASILFIATALGVAIVGVVLARAADHLGAAFRLSRSITGFMLLAAATSLPELIISCQVARSGAIDMAIGSLLGSCLMNLLILAAIDLSRRSRGRMLTRQAAAHALASLASILMATLVAIAVLLPDLPSIGRLHLASLVLVVGYVITVRLVYVDRQVSEAKDLEPSQEAAPPKLRPVSIYIFATLGILALASPLASSSNSLAGFLGLSGTFFGAVFLALITSLPEVVTTYEASRMGAEDMAIGNIFGSNACNLLILVAVDICYHQPLYASLSSVHAIAALGIIVTTTVATMGLLYRVEKRIWYMEPDAVGVILIALLFYYLLYVL